LRRPEVPPVRVPGVRRPSVREPVVRESRPVVSGRPAFEVDGKARADVGAALLALDLTLPRHGMAHAEIRLSAAAEPGRAAPFGDLVHGRAVTVSLDGGPSEAFAGEITGVELRMGEGGPPELVLLAEDRLHRLARLRAPRSFDGLSPGEVVRRVAADAGLLAEVGFDGAPRDFVKGPESDLAFLLRLVAAEGAVLRFRDGKLRAGPEVEDASPVALDAAAVERLRIVAELNWQAARVAVRGWSLGAGAEVSGQGAPPAVQSGQRRAVDVLKALDWGGPVVRAADLGAAAEADARAEAEMAAGAGRFLHGEIVAADPALLPGREVALSGTDPRFTGRYRVGDCLVTWRVAEGLRVTAAVARAFWNE
jgi:phage protein D